ncbi:cobalamin adenosyltransferase [Desulfitobacterium sp. THU1]|uniref:cobalamin adenosyltransferase n=1 Tax=Desulfitobacterium sp. THU1 TaxID=3138072 RepID=UPI003120317C
MRYITDRELRDLYKIEPFTTYTLEPQVKFTPEARQFLVDRGIKIQNQNNDGHWTNNSGKKPGQGRESWGVLKLRGRMETIESLFLLVAADLLATGDNLLAEDVLTLRKYFCKVLKSEREQKPLEPIQFWGWSEGEIRDCTHSLEKPFEINEFHVCLEEGKTIALLNHLRAALREVEPAILEAYGQDEKQVCLRQDLIDQVNLMIDIICIMIGKSLGGQKCKP